MNDQTTWKLANALVQFMDGVPDHEIVEITGLSEQEASEIAGARKLARELLTGAPPTPVVEVTKALCIAAAQTPVDVCIFEGSIFESATAGEAFAWLRKWQQVLNPQLGLVSREEIERLRVALRDCAQKAEALKRPCGDDPESAQAVRNAQYQAISAAAHLALGTINGPEMYVTREEMARAQEEIAALRLRQEGARGWRVIDFVCTECGKGGASFLHAGCAPNAELAALRARVARLTELLDKLNDERNYKYSRQERIDHHAKLLADIDAALRSEE